MGEDLIGTKRQGPLGEVEVIAQRGDWLWVWSEVRQAAFTQHKEQWLAWPVEGIKCE